VLPFRLAPEGTDTISVRGLSRPSRLRLFDAATGNEEVFNFDDQNVVGLAGYFPAKTNRSGYTFLALTTDGFQLEHKSGTQITFDRSGQFRTLVVDILDQLVQDPYEVRFEYGIARGQYRIVTAHVFERKSDAAIYAVVYKYGRDGNLIGTSIASSR
jgi:hypothetical protein